MLVKYNFYINYHFNNSAKLIYIQQNNSTEENFVHKLMQVLIIKFVKENNY